MAALTQQTTAFVPALGQCAISHRDDGLAPKTSLTIYADMVQLKTSHYNRIGNGKAQNSEARRGKIRGFSRRSRKRLFQLLAKCRDVPDWHVTLTYPDDYPEDRETFKAHLDTLIKRLKRRYPGVAGVWKLEPQQRGAPHYHVLIWFAGCEQKPTQKRFDLWMRLAWHEVIRSDDYWHTVYGAKTQAISSRRMAYSYVAKYIAKLPDDDGSEQDGSEQDGGENDLYEWGRWWGKFGDLDTEAVMVISGIPEDVAVELRRLLRAWHFSRARARENPQSRKKAIKFSKRLLRRRFHGGFVLGFGDGGNAEKGCFEAIMRLFWHASGQKMPRFTRWRGFEWKNTRKAMRFIEALQPISSD